MVDDLGYPERDPMHRITAPTDALQIEALRVSAPTQAYRPALPAIIR
jgi:hypothetical protein